MRQSIGSKTGQIGTVKDKKNELSLKQIIAAKKILSYLKLCKTLREAYEYRFQELLLQNVAKIQRAIRSAKLRRNAQKKGLYRATIHLDTSNLCLGPVSTVDIFGEFTEDAPWKTKVKCTRRLPPASNLYSADIDIKLGQKFKFIIDNGRAYAISEHYRQASDDAGITNNVFIFNQVAIVR